MLYSTDCPKCKILESKLDEKKVDYRVCSDVEVMQSKGFSSVPMLEVDKEIMNFNGAIRWIQSM